ncbi:MAG TPA: 3'-5' exonuclease, partial [Thermoguttaceae bacterium]|nr:3'-5' exonuclease [Thermoguttaceae bacterium]
EALRRYDIDYYLVGGHAFYAQQEIFDLLNLLRAIESTCDEVSLVGVLRSPFFGLFDETLFWLAQHSEGLAGRMLDDSPLPEPIQGDQRRRVETAKQTLGQLRAIKDRVPVARLIQEALQQTGYDAILLAEFLGERKLANLRKLIDQARSFDRSGIFTLADFILQLSQFVVRQPDEALAATHPESTDIVRLMTIHQSKGLEFPVVVVADVDRARRGGGSSITFTRELGPMIKDTDAVGGYDLHAQAERDAELEESVRLLYVATTRAADYLILSAGLQTLGSTGGPWTELIQSRFGDSTDGRIRVTTQKPPLDRKPSGKTRRPDTTELVREARQMADDGVARMPKYLEPIRPDNAERRQFSFSRLTGTLHGTLRDANGKTQNETRLALDPQSEPPAIDPRGLGTLVHAALAELDFRNPGDIGALVRRHAERHLLDDGPLDDDALDEPIALIQRFLDSPRAACIAAARATHAELEFLLAWPPGSEEPEGRYLQGFIDCLYQDEDGRWHVLDYKTNRVSEATLDAVADDYRMQMSVYALAVERILGESPSELVLHFLRGSLEKHFAWDDAARADAVAWVEKQLPSDG